MPVNIVRREVPDDIDLSGDLHPVLKRIFAARNVRSTAELDYSLHGLLSYHSLRGIEQAVTMLAETIKCNKRLLIIADFDADGATSCALAMRGLGLMGATNLHYLVPNRFEFGYGLSPEIVKVATQYQPDVLLTVDNGIASIEGVDLARSLNMDVLITDHHLPGDRLPDANAIVNPNQPEDQFPSKNLAGVGVMFYVLVALRSHLRKQDWFNMKKIPDPKLAVLLDLVALGTVADVVPLDHNNRILVAQGLSRIRSGKCCTGIRELLKAANRPLCNISAQDLSFVVAPRLNAAGRLTDMSLGIECLLTDDEYRAREMAVQLDKLNRERREIQAEMHAQALTDITGLFSEDTASLPDGMCLFRKDWHQGVIGVLASKIKDKLHRPVIAFAPDKDGFIKGSARSVDGVHIRDVLDTIASQQPQLIDKFGGHAMAAGLTMREENFEVFRELFAQVVRQFLDEEKLDGNFHSDGELSTEDMNFNLAECILAAGPWGQGFPEPVFDGPFEIVTSKIVGEHHLKLQLKSPGKNKILEAIAFNTTGDDWPEAITRVHTVYKLDINEFAGRRRLQLVVDYITPLDETG